eukprot:symbB.v1.2.021464.t1/scaffold1852.1/size98719/4
MDFTEADSLTRAIDRLAMTDLCVPSSWSEASAEQKDAEASVTESLAGSVPAELVGSLRELAEASGRQRSELGYRRTSTFPSMEKMEKVSSTFVRRSRSDQSCITSQAAPVSREETSTEFREARQISIEAIPDPPDLPVPNESTIRSNETVPSSVPEIPEEGESPKPRPTKEVCPADRSSGNEGSFWKGLQGRRVWKKRSNLSRSTMVFRLLRREARALLSRGEEWLVGGGSLHLGRVGLLAREVMALLATPETRPALEAPGRAEPGTKGPRSGPGTTSTSTSGAVQAVDHSREPLWDKTHLCLREGGFLQWVRPLSEKAAQERQEDRSPTADGNQLGQLGPLHGSSVEFMGIQSNPRCGRNDHRNDVHVLHVFRLFPPHHLRRQPMTFAVETSMELEQWLGALRCVMEVKVPTPQPHSRWLRAVDFWEARGPPEGCEAPPATLQLQVLCTSGLVAKIQHDFRPESGEYPCQVGYASSHFSSAGPHNLYVVGKVHGVHFRTATRYGVDCAGVTIFGHHFQLPLWFENPDEMIDFKVYHEPEYDDSEPILLGGIRLPLFSLRRQRRLGLELPLKQDDATRRGFVNVSFGHLTIAATVEQPLGHLFLPVELHTSTNSTGDATSTGGLDWSDLEKQISRLVELIQMVFVRWQNSVIFVIQWERFWYSLSWFLFMELWFLVLWRWSLPIIFALLLKRTLDLRRRSAAPGLSAPATTVGYVSSLEGIWINMLMYNT